MTWNVTWDDKISLRVQSLGTQRGKLHEPQLILQDEFHGISSGKKK